MVTVDGLSSGRGLPEPMVVEVTAVDWNTGESRRAEVELVDTERNRLRLVDYEGADLAVDWTANHRYRVSRCGVNKGGKGYGVELAPSKRTRIDPLGPVDGGTSLLVVGDTHVGRSQHPKTDEKIDPLGAFTAAVDYGLDREVDAVVHVGDIFHESATPSDATLTDTNVFAPLQDAGIPFYYVRGNHGSDAGDDVLATHANVVNLDTAGVTVGENVRIFGINHFEDGELPWRALTFPTESSEQASILVLHQTLRQLSGPKPDSVDLERIQRRFEGRFDFVLSGHHHDSISTNWRGVPVLYTGASVNLSTNKDPIDRVAWYVTTDATPLSPERYDIP